MSRNQNESIASPLDDVSQNSSAENKILKLDLSSLDPNCRQSAIEAFDRGDGRTFAGCGYPTGACLSVVFDNRDLLIQKGMYEEALVHGFIGGKNDNGNVSLSKVQELFDCADREKLLQCGDGLPEDRPLMIYRGVSGPRNRRRVHGFSWTTSIQVACWFARRLENPAVYEATCDLQEIYFATNERNEFEVVARPGRKKVSEMVLTSEEIASHAADHREFLDELHRKRRDQVFGQSVTQNPNYSTI